MTLSWSPANDHLIVDGLETVTLTTLAATTTTIYRVLRLPALVDIGSAGALTSYGNITRWNIWIQECPTAPEINALIDRLPHRPWFQFPTYCVVLIA
jgi:hypothetical protein